jgi:hypothetical protein
MRGKVAMKPHVKDRRSRRASAATLIDFIAVVAVALALVLGGLWLVRESTRPSAKRLGCTSQMRQIGLAFRTWGLDKDGRFPTSVSVTNEGARELAAAGDVSFIFKVMSNELSTTKILVCPNDANRTAATNFVALANTNLSYFVNVDAVETNWTVVLAGDRNLTNRRSANSRFVSVSGATTLGWDKALHHECGNLLHADGRVDVLTNGRATISPDTNSAAVNRLAMP